MSPPDTASSSSGDNSSRTSRTSLFEVVLLIIFYIQASVDHPAGEATLAHRSRWRCEPVHQQYPTPTFCDGHHSAGRDDAVLGPHNGPLSRSPILTRGGPPYAQFRLAPSDAAV